MSSNWQLTSRTPEVLQAILKAAEQGVSKAADDVLDRSNEKVPTESGALRASGSVEAQGLTADISYTAPYAVVQHEKTEYRHDDGQAKFLEQALLSSPDQVLQVIAAEIGGAIS